MTDFTTSRETSPHSADTKPVFVLTGFLGSGKTTLLCSLLADPRMRDTAVLINELGEVALDHLLVRQVTDDVVLLRSGCLCCTVRDDLVSTLEDLSALQRKGEIQAYSRVVVETTGLADPAPVVQTLMDSGGAAHRLSAIVTTLDCTHAFQQLDSHVEAARQLALADRVVFTKTDLASEADRRKLRARVRQVAPAAELFDSAPANVPPPSLLFAEGSFDIALKEETARRWIEEEAARKEQRQVGSFAFGRHDSRVATFSVRMTAPIEWAKFMTWIELLLTARGNQILRFKGLMNVAGNEKPFVIQGVQHVIYPPETLASWPTADRRTCLTFITQDLSRTAVENSMRLIFGADHVLADSAA